MNSPHVLNIGVAFCTPIPLVNGPNGPRLSMVTTEWHRKVSNLVMPTNFNKVTVQTDGMEVGDARNKAAQLVLDANPRPKYLFFLDYDVLPAHDAIQKLLYRAQTNPDHDIFAGVYCSKVDLSEPLIYKSWGEGPYWDWTVGDLLSEGVVGVHMGCTLIRTSLFERLESSEEKPWFLTQNRAEFNHTGLQFVHGTEDLYFCKRVCDEIGPNRIFVDTSVLCGHIDHATGRIFGLPKDSPPVKRAFWVQNGWDREKIKAEEAKEADPSVNSVDTPLLRAIDLGAGEHRRSWPGYKTFGTDIREGLGPDVLVQDTLALNLPDESFDLVASSHHLEHIPRTEQERVWREMFRICKTGGKIEHVVPSLDWAGAMLYDGMVDEHVYNVLYGAQEAHGYKRELNLHYFGYTKAVAKALAEGVGFSEVECTDWRDDESLGYNLIIRGVKAKPDRKPDNVPASLLHPLTEEAGGLMLPLTDMPEDSGTPVTVRVKIPRVETPPPECRAAEFLKDGKLVSCIADDQGRVLANEKNEPVTARDVVHATEEERKLWSFVSPETSGLKPSRPFDQGLANQINSKTEGPY